MFCFLRSESLFRPQKRKGTVHFVSVYFAAKCINWTGADIQSWGGGLICHFINMCLPLLRPCWPCRLLFRWGKHLRTIRQLAGSTCSRTSHLLLWWLPICRWLFQCSVHWRSLVRAKDESAKKWRKEHMEGILSSHVHFDFARCHFWPITNLVILDSHWRDSAPGSPAIFAWIFPPSGSQRDERFVQNVAGKLLLIQEKISRKLN